METNKVLTIECLNELMTTSDLSYVAELTNIPYATLYNYKVNRSHITSIPYRLINELSQLAFKLGTIEIKRGSQHG